MASNYRNVRGGPDNGAFANGATRDCNSTVANACVALQWPFGWTAHEQKFFQPRMWNGSLLEEKRDGSGLVFKRNRYLDPATGRFTQEDPIGLAGGVNLYGFAAGDPVNFGDPFWLCPPKTMAEVLLCTGQLLRPAQKPLEIAGSLAILPLSGGGFAAEGISAELLALGQTLRSGAGSGILTAAGVAQRVANATGGTVGQLRKSEGFSVTVQGRKNIVARIKTTGDMRVGIDRMGGLTREGELSSDKALTHLQNLLSQDLIDLVNKAKQIVGVPR